MDARKSLLAVAALTLTVLIPQAVAQDQRAGDRYVVDLAVAGMPVELSDSQELLAESLLPSTDDFNTPGQNYLNVLANSGWQPINGDAESPCLRTASRRPAWATSFSSTSLAGSYPAANGAG